MSHRHRLGTLSSSLYHLCTDNSVFHMPLWVKSYQKSFLKNERATLDGIMNSTNVEIIKIHLQQADNASAFRKTNKRFLDIAEFPLSVIIVPLSWK